MINFTRRGRARRAAGTLLAMSAVLTLAPLAWAAPAAAADTWVRGAVLADDEFARTTTAGLGSAPTGGVYTHNDGTSYKVGNGRATVGPVPAGVATSTRLGAVSGTDVEVMAEAILPTVGTSNFSTYQGVQLRRTADGSAYRVRLVVNDSGRSFVNIERVRSGRSTALAHVHIPATTTAGATMMLDARVMGTAPVTVEARAWVKGHPAPAWQAAVADSSPERITTAGAVGTWHYNDRGSLVTFQLDRLTAWNLAKSAGTTTTSPTTTAPTTSTTSSAAAPTTATAPRGSAPVGAASYAVPSGALIVDGARGSDSSSGTLQAPKKTIAAGIAAASSGRTVVVRAGTYHESVTIPASKSITVQNYPGEAVWLDGSRPVTGWTQSGATWVLKNWTAEFDDSASFTTGRDHPAMLEPGYPAAAKPDQVFIDGVQQRQVLSASQVVPGTFAVDYAGNRLILGTNPSGRSVRATDLAFAVDVLGSKNTVQGIGVRRYATPMPRIGTVRVWGGANTIRNVVVEDAATVGISFTKSGNVADRVTVTRAGLLGIHGNTADNIRITNSVVQGSNSEHFHETPAAGGIKLTKSRGIVIDNVLAQDNFSRGIWMDESCYNIKIVNSESTGNDGTGIELEVSDTGIVANNKATNNDTNGILIFDTANIKVFNNEIGGNGMMGLKLWQDHRRQADGGSQVDRRQPFPDPTVTWITRNITVANNVFGTGGMFQVYALDKETRRAVDTWNVTINGNLFNPRPSTSLPTMVAWGGNDNVKLYRYETPAALAAAKNSAWRNAQASSSLPLSEMVKLAPSHAGIAVGLPSDVASAVGVAAGTKVVGTIKK